MKKHEVFVYGSLRQGLHNHVLLKDAEFVGMARATGLLIGLGSFPALLPGDEPVVGEVYRVNAATLARLDQLEGHPTLYKRTAADVDMDGQTRQVELYVLQQARARWMAPVPKTADGAYDWMLEIEARRRGGLSVIDDRRRA